jgi:carbon-monoxide dehydrogenase medium subunit
MLAYNAHVIAVGRNSTRTIPIDNFFVDLFTNSMHADEILTEIRIPKPAARSGGAYVKLERKVGDYAISAVAVQLTLDGNRCVAARIGLTNVNPVPMRAKNAEQSLISNSLTDNVIEAAGAAAAAECDPSPDLRGSIDYKRDITRVLTKRAIRSAIERAR